MSMKFKKKGGVTQAKVRGSWVPWRTYLNADEAERDAMVGEAGDVEGRISDALINSSLSDSPKHGGYGQPLMATLAGRVFESETNVYTINEYNAEDPKRSFPCEIRIRYDPDSDSFTVELFEIRGEDAPDSRRDLESALNGGS